MKNLIYILTLFLWSFTTLSAQAPAASMNINCPSTPNIPGTNFTVTVNYNYSNIVGGNIIVVLNYDDAMVQYSSSGGSITPVITGPSGGIRTLTYTFPVNSVGNDTSFIQVFFQFRCPSTCFGTNLTSNFTGNIRAGALTNIPASPCSVTTTVPNNWNSSHSVYSYNCVNNSVTFRIILNGSTCFKIENPSLSITPSIAGATLIATSYGTISGSSINIPALMPNNNYWIFYTIQLPCATTAPSVLTNTVNLTGDNCNNPVSNIVPIANASYSIPANTITAAALSQSTSATQNTVSVTNSGSTPTNINLTTLFPLVNINSINFSSSTAPGITTTPTMTMDLFNCSNVNVGTYTSFPLTSLPLLTKAQYSILNLAPGQTVYVSFNYDKTNSCTGLNTSNCVEFVTSGDYISYVVATACNCKKAESQLFTTVKTQYCIKPQINCNSSSIHSQCFVKDDIIPICFSFSNYGTADLLGGSLTYTLPSSVNYNGNLTVNGVSTTGTLVGSVLTIPLSIVPFSGSPIQTVCFETKVKPTAVYGPYYSMIQIQGSNLPLQVVGDNWNCPAYFNICIDPHADIEKLVKGSEDSSFSANGTGMAGSTATYQIKVKNTGNVPITDIEVLDRTSETGDKMITTCAPRNSVFSMPPFTTNPLTPLSLNPFATFSNSPGGMNNLPSSWTGLPTACNTSGTFSSGSGNTIKVNLPNPILPFTDYTFELKVQVDAGAKAGDKACNSVALRCFTQNYDGSKTLLNVTESGLACLTIAPPPCDNCKDLLSNTGFTVSPGTTTSASSPYVVKTGTVKITITKPVQEIHISVADLQYSWDKEGCTDCKSPAITRGCLFPMTTTQNIGSGGSSGYLVWDNYTGVSLPTATAVTDCPEELIWKLGVMLQPGTYSIPIQLTLPKSVIEDCCKLHIDKFDIKVSLKDEDCKVCESIITPSTDDCCTGSKWIKKQMTFDLMNNDQLSKAKINSNNEKLEEIFANNILVNNKATEVIANPIPWYGVENITCGNNQVYRLLEGDTRTFSGSFSCNPSLKNCNSEVLISIKTISGNYINVVNQPSAVVQTFALAGVYEVTYTGMCGGKKCDECTFKVIVEKNCCPAIKTKASTITTTLIHASTKPLTFPPVASYISSSAIKVNLFYTCPQGCNPTYVYTRAHKNASGVFVIVPGGGGSGTSPLTIALPVNGEDRITISVKCGNQVCSNAIESFIISKGSLTISDTALPNLDLLNNSQQLCDSCNPEDNLIFNGDFNMGNTGFTSGFNYYEYSGDPKDYRVNQGWFGFENPTDKCIRVQSSYTKSSTSSTITWISQISGKLLWKNTAPILVESGKKYTLCFKIRNIWQGSSTSVNALSNPGYPDIICDVYINGTLVLPNVQIGAGGTILNSYSIYGQVYHNTNWVEFNSNWIATSSTATIEIKFKNKTYPTVSGWQFALDDIIFKKCN